MAPAAAINRFCLYAPFFGRLCSHSAWHPPIYKIHNCNLHKKWQPYWFHHRFNILMKEKMKWGVTLNWNSDDIVITHFVWSDEALIMLLLYLLPPPLPRLYSLGWTPTTSFFNIDFTWCAICYILSTSDDAISITTRRFIILRL